jgi:uncharacterized repeat protein (TIGR01451 family)
MLGETFTARNHAFSRVSRMFRNHRMCRAGLLPGLAVLWGSAAWAQAPATPETPPVPPAAPVTPAAPDAQPQPAVIAADPAAVVPVLPVQVQVVRFKAPAGVKLEVLGPPPEALPGANESDPLTVGLRVGVGYRLKLSNLPGNPTAEVYPTIEVVGHLHRPQGINPLKFPIRVVFDDEDLEEVAAKGHLVTHVVYLEDPEQAVPITLPKDEIPKATIGPGEDPLKVAAALGRVMAIVRVGGRAPTVDEFNADAAVIGLTGGRCPFVGPEGEHCPLPCGPARGTPPPVERPWVPADEYLCDGGDHGTPAHFAGDGSLRGIDPRDAMIQFRRPTMAQLQPEFERLKGALERKEISRETYEIETRRLTRSTQEGENRPRVLPTNMVCIYAPRFAVVRGILGSSAAIAIDVARGHEILQKGVMDVGRAEPIRLTQNEAIVANRHRSRPSLMQGRVWATAHAEVRVLMGIETIQHPGLFEKGQRPQARQLNEKAAAMRDRAKAVALKSAESVVVTGIVQGPNQMVMAWKPQEITGVEEPPSKPGLVIVKRSSANEAEPGEVVTFTIQYRNMGNVPIGSVSIVDSLLPRLEYVAGSAQGPKGTVFTAGENRAGSTELRWDLPDAIPAGAEGIVTFQARVR